MSERVKELREAFEAGAAYQASGFIGSWKVEAARRYPIPVKPRVVADPHGCEPHWGKPREWAFIGGNIVSRTVGYRLVGAEAVPYPWSNKAQVHATPARLRLWADLMERPTEESE